MSELLFTSASIIDFLSNIEELEGKDISLSETESGIVITIDGISYDINGNEANDVEVEEEVVAEVEGITDEAFDDLENNTDIEIYDEDEAPVEGGPIKELAKTLLIGGMVRLAAKTLRGK